MQGIRTYSFVVTFLTFGFFFLGLTEEGFSGFSADITCCQGEGQCVDSSEGPFLCQVDDVVDNAFCDQGSGLCTQITGIAPIPTLNEWGLIAMAGVLGIAGFLIIRRRKAAA
jgi:hypothetical protein